ncbi:MAG: lysophospholipid acyltransferase family protein [Alphaproteobacteria bacterium]
MRSSLRALVRLLVYAGWTLALLPAQAFAVAFGLRLAERIPQLYHRACCRIIGLNVVCRGSQSRDRPSLFVANHSSYLDITVLGSLIPGSFVAKAEVASWPVFGLLAKLQRTVFVERRPSHTAQDRDEISRRLEAGENLILFPEGTSNDGNRVLPFKSAYFGAAERSIRGAPLTVQPLSIAYVRLDGVPIGREWRVYYAWYGDMVMAPHVWNVLGLGRVTVEVRFHPPVTIEELGTRKALSNHCHRVVAEGVAEALSGPVTRPKLAAAGR